MKIGVVTFWWSNDNYGQLLQCWALQKQLRLLGHAPYLIRYSEYDRSKSSLKSRIIMKIKEVSLIGFIYKTLKFKGYLTNYIRDKQRNFDAFRKTYFEFSDYYYSSLKDIQENYPQADVYITGSDQVWAHLLDKEYNTIFFLNFGNKRIKRIAYAPSFGMDSYPERLMPTLKKALSRFDALSVRENSGIKICKDAGYEATHVLDPTILLPTKEYQILISQNKVNTPYIYIYSVNINNSRQLQWDALQRFASIHHLKTIATTATGYFPASEIFAGAEYDYSSIPQWLSNIKNAQLVITTSFHGVVFSILFHTNFVYFPIEGRFGRGNGRVISLLEMVGLLDRVYSPNVSFDDFYQTNIDWTLVENIIGAEREKSLYFLKKCLNSRR